MLSLVVTSGRIGSDGIFLNLHVEEARSSAEGKDMVAWGQAEGMKEHPQKMGKKVD